QAIAATVQLSPVAFLTVLSGYFAITLQARNRHSYSLFEAFPAFGIIVAVLLIPTTDLQPLLWGTLLGALLQAAVSGFVAFRSGIVGFGMGWRVQSLGFATLFAGAGALIVTQILLAITIPIDQAFAANL